ncbi:MAG: hypothetical protein M1825_004907 [Sarcosagium campestre]|nr:MAG: hypothetical protein M1825_004907 [Sarcosagium campestre]
MAHFLRGKQAGVSNDLSAGIIPELFSLDDFARYGINSQIASLAYDPVQSLLAVGTNESQYGSGQVYIFGQNRVSAVFNLPRKASVRHIHFCAEKLIVVHSKNEIVIYSLELKRQLASYAPPGYITAIATDPCMDWALLGLQNGEIVAYDLDREALAPFKIPNFWRERSPRARVLQVVSLALHPRDIGTLLIGYTEGAVTYSFKQNKPLSYFHYQLPPGAPGGDSDPTSMNSLRTPRLSQALWHPTGTFVLTGHEDSSLVVWDPKDGRIIMARTIQDTNVQLPSAAVGLNSNTRGNITVKEPIFKISWCAKENPDDTGILVAGGASTTLPTKGLTFLELGPTPAYATSSWQILSAHFENPKRQGVLPTPPQADVVDFCLIPRASPHFAGASDPVAVLALLSSGEVATLSFPSGFPISPSNHLHVSLSFVHPFINNLELTGVERMRWLGMTEKRQIGPPLLRGGAKGTHPMKRFESRNIIQTAHADGSIRLWDAGHGDEIENGKVIQVDIARALGRVDGVEVSKTSMAGVTGELAVGLVTGEVAVFRWERNREGGSEAPIDADNPPGLSSIVGRADPALNEGLLPFTLFNHDQGPVTALKMSDVGFIGIGYESGAIAVIDMRGPAVIFSAHLDDLAKPSKRASIRRSNSQAHPKPDWPTVLEFGVMSLEGDDYSSILFFAGTQLGRLATFKLLPSANGGFSVQFVGSTSLEARVVTIAPMNADNGTSAFATQAAVGGLRNGLKVNGVLVAVTETGARIFRPAAAKGAYKSWDDYFCYSAAKVNFESRGHVLVGLFGDGYARAYSLPALKEINHARLIDVLDVKRLREAIITSSGDILGWTGPSEMAILNVWGNGQPLPKSNDTLFNVEAIVPARPTISNFQWISGTQYVSPADMDILIGGPDRPMSRRMIEQARVDEQQRQSDGRPSASASASGSGSAQGGQDEGYWAYMQRQLNERTEKLGIVGDSMDRVQENSSGWASDVNKYVNQQKRKAVMGAIGGKFGF